MIDNKHKITEKVREVLTYQNRRSVNTSKRLFSEKHSKSPDFQPIFFLSTGRCGTAFCTELLGKSKHHIVSHKPCIELIEAGKIAYELYRSHGFMNPTVNQCMQALIRTARDAPLYEAFLHQKQYIETNNRITFLAPALRHVYPHAKFVHLHRHPAKFIRSGMRRNWYKNDDIHETGRITPIAGQTKQEWDRKTQLEKIAWLWSETNRYIIDFLTNLPEKSKLSLEFNTENTNTMIDLCSFCNIEVSSAEIKKLKKRHINRQTQGVFPEYPLWKTQDKLALFELCAETANELGYTLKRP